MIGMIKRAPISINSWLCAGAAACHRVMDGGMIAGQMLMPSPLKPRKTRISVRIKAFLSSTGLSSSLYRGDAFASLSIAYPRLE